MDRLITRLMDLRIVGSLDPFNDGLLHLWIARSMDLWIARSMDRKMNVHRRMNACRKILFLEYIET